MHQARRLLAFDPVPKSNPAADPYPAADPPGAPDFDLVSDLVSKSYPTADPYAAPDFFDDELIFDGVFDGVLDGAFDGVLDIFDDTWLTLSLGRTGSSNLLLLVERLLLAFEWKDATDCGLLFEAEE